MNESAKEGQSIPLKRWWWFNPFPFDWSREERRAGTCLLFIQLILFLILMIPTVAVFRALAFEEHVVALLAVISSFTPTFPLARMILARVNPHLLTKADENATRRITAKRTP
jgi:hypothetical protein